MFVDGRYTLQAAKQVDRKAWSIEPLVDPPPESWLARHLAAGDRLGFDPWLHTFAAAERLAAACAKAGAELVAVDSNPLDSVWTERPPPPLGPVSVHGMQFSGEAEAEKLGRIRLEMTKLGVDALVLSDSHAVAWTFNIRGADVSHTPLPLSYALVPKDGRPTVVHRSPQAVEQRPRPSRTVGRCRGAGRADAKADRTGATRRFDRARQRHRRRRAEPPDIRRRRQAGARQRSRQPAQGASRTPPRSRAPRPRIGATRWR